LLLDKINKVEILEAITKTIKYSQKYKCQLTLDQLHQRLISPDVFKKEEVKKFIKSKVCKVVKSKENIIFEEKLEKAKELASKIAKKFSDILFIGISGSVAAGYPKKDDDIDLFLITKKNCLWINRFRLRLFIYINRIPHRKFNKQQKPDQFCFNIWMDEQKLNINSQKQNLKNAMDLILLIPILNKNYSYERLIKANDWAKKYVANGYIRLLRHKVPRNDTKLTRVAFLDGVINYLVFWPQYWYMKKKINSEEINLYRAFFHQK
jgi:hypothetical protein